MPDWLDKTSVQAAAAAVQAGFALLLIWLTRSYVRETRLIAKETRAMAASTERMVAVSQDQYRAALRPAVVSLLRQAHRGAPTVEGFRIAARNEGPGPALDCSCELLGSPFRYRASARGTSSILRGGGEEMLIDYSLDGQEPFTDPDLGRELSAARTALRVETEALNEEMIQGAFAAGLKPSERGGSILQPPPHFDEPREALGRRHKEITELPRRLASEQPSLGALQARYWDVYGREWTSATALEYEQPVTDEASKDAWPVIRLGATVFTLRNGS